MRKRLLCTAAALFAWGCGDGSTPPDVATAVAVTPGSVSLDAVGARQVVRAAVTDQDGQAMPAAAITWSSSSAAVTVAGAGGDSAIVTAAGNGSATITAVSGSASGTVAAQVAQVAATVVKASGDIQTGTVAAPLAQPLRATARDRLGAPAVGVTVTFSIVEGGGMLSSTSAVTGQDGNAAVTWTLGTAAGAAHRVRAAVSAASAVEFNATATAGAPVSAVVGGGNGQSATPGSAVAVAPSVIVRDAYGNGVEGVTAQFTVSGGGGSVTGATAMSGLGGYATVGSWTLGAMGANALTVTFPGTAIPPVTITATASGTGTVAIAGGQNQGAMVGTAVPTAPSVVVRSGAGTPLAGISVTFTVTAGGGTVANATVTTNASGIASAGSWVMGPTSGPNTLRASVSGLTAAPVDFRGIGCEGTGPGYTMTLCFTTPMTPSQRSVFITAANRWSTVITGDLPGAPTIMPANACANSPAINMTVDDLLIFAGIETIDGPGQVLGQAGPCDVRDVGLLPTVGVMRFDAADVAGLEAGGGFASVILHEMGHVLGVGTLWNAFGLLQDPSPPSGAPTDAWYSGAGGLLGFNNVGGATYTGGQKVPVENSGGGGTANAHWRESVLKNELMTGYINNGSNPLSQLTVRSLSDIGYAVNVTAADAFSLAMALRATRVGATGAATVDLGDDLYRGPQYTVDSRGRVTRLPSR